MMFPRGLVTLVVNTICELNYVNQLVNSCPASMRGNSFLSPRDQNIGDNCNPAPRDTCDPNNIYYSYDGSCNNLDATFWGEAKMPYTRLIAASYADDFCSVRTTGSDGQPLPPARKIRTTVLTNLEKPSNSYNILFNGFGQWFTHDVSRMQTATSPQPCCTGENATATDTCLPLIIPPDDPFYSQFDQTCLEQTRAVNTKSQGCEVSPCLPINFQTGVLDLSILYGADENTVNKLRSFQNGELLISGTQGRVKHSFPPISSDPNTCPAGGIDANSCMVTGDPRINLNPELTITEIIFLRAHNSIAASLVKNHPDWDDEKTFQEARRILIAIYKQIVFGELIPAYTGIPVAARYNLLPASRGYVNKYVPTLNPQTIVEYAFAVGRSHHSMIRGKVRYQANNGQTTSYRLSDKYFNQKFLLEQNTFTHVLEAYMLQNSNRQTRHFSEEVSDLLLPAQGASFGSDLPSTDINRGLDSGIPPYNDVRDACGLRRLENFDELAEQIMEPRLVSKLSTIYASVDDIDFYVGGLLEKPLGGALVGPTFACVIAEASYRWKFGDRLHYEFPEARFRPGQLRMIRRATFAHLLCLSNPNLKSVPKRAFLTPSTLNPSVSCRGLPGIDFSVF